MSTKATLTHYIGTAGEPSWHFYEDVFQSDAVYLELTGVSVELRTLEEGGATVVVRLPLATAEQLGLTSKVVPERWARVCDSDKP